MLYNCGVEYCNPGWSYGPKRREYHFIHFVKEGKGTLTIEGHTFHIHKNQCLSYQRVKYLFMPPIKKIHVNIPGLAF
ncbi:AraC family ligand binding domain-containing protein [Lactobacillus helveticus]|uniref:AraC family ligand binding domain-containing protein n=1 Tax=Lactobacillus helveticus TaxID=1587 RepID=UPI00345F9ADD